MVEEGQNSLQEKPERDDCENDTGGDGADMKTMALIPGDGASTGSNTEEAEHREIEPWGLGFGFETEIEPMLDDEVDRGWECEAVKDERRNRQACEG